MPYMGEEIRVVGQTKGPVARDAAVGNNQRAAIVDLDVHVAVNVKTVAGEGQRGTNVHGGRVEVVGVGRQFTR